jgi:XTP/dITP diphosphohydrolase
MIRRTILLGTSNAAKARKLQWLLEGLDIDVVLPQTRASKPLVDETGTTFRENAEAKAAAWSDMSGGLALSSDGGVSIPILGPFWDPLRTARAAESDDDLERVRHLLELMRPYEGAERAVEWTEAAALADRGRVIGSWEAFGQRGVLAQHVDPNTMVRGFWLSNLWFYPEFGKLHKDLTSEELELVDMAWLRLRQEVQSFLREHLSALLRTASR